MDGMVERIGVFALVGLGSGFVSGLFGVGGGIVRIPLFVYLLPLFGVAHSVMMHVAVGLLMLAALLAWSLLGYFDQRRHSPLSIGALYWHFVTAVWLAVFGSLDLAPHLGVGT